MLNNVSARTVPSSWTKHWHPMLALNVSVFLTLSKLSNKMTNDGFFLYQVPDAIKSQYQNPPPMLLPAGMRQLELVCSSISDHASSDQLATEAEQQEVRLTTGPVIGPALSLYKHHNRMFQIIVFWSLFLVSSGSRMSSLSNAASCGIFQ